MNVAHRSKPLKWVVADEPDPTFVEELSAATGIPKNVVKILINRGLTTAAEVDMFLNPKLSDLEDPFSLKGMKLGVERVTQALFNNEKITIYGDYDVDGITATALLYMVLNKLGAQVDFYLPNRLTEGYGLSRDGIDKSKSHGVSLIITVDTGITAVEEISYAASIGIDVLVTDHHEPGIEYPKAYAIVNPKQAGCSYRSSCLRTAS